MKKDIEQTLDFQIEHASALCYGAGDSSISELHRDSVRKYQHMTLEETLRSIDKYCSIQEDDPGRLSSSQLRTLDGLLYHFASLKCTNHEDEQMKDLRNRLMSAWGEVRLYFISVPTRQQEH